MYFWVYWHGRNFRNTQARRDTEHKEKDIPASSFLRLDHSLFTGVSDKPTLSAWPSSLVPIGEHVTLKCLSQLGFEVFRLFKENDVHNLEFQNIIFRHSFDINPMTMAHVGTYRCQGFEPNDPYKFSEISEPLLIIVTGETTHVRGILHCSTISIAIMSTIII